MFRFRILLFLAVSSVLAPAQNLVPNGSFEAYTDCPDYWNQLIGNVAGWDVCSPSPDFFHACRDSSDFGVPYNWRGYQHASHGQGYGGVGTFQWNAPNYREFICAELAQQLSPGVPVDLSMKVALGVFGSYGLYSPKWTTTGIGMLLTTQPFVWSSGSACPNTAQLYMDTVFTDTANWVLLSTTYVPDSAYQYVILGNFFEDSLSSPIILDTVFGNLNGAYAFIDEVCITPAGMYCDFANVVGSLSLSNWRVTSPFSERLEITFGSVLEVATDLMLYDAGGRLIARRTIAAGSMGVEWPVCGLANGVYVVLAANKEPKFKPIRVLHVSP
jgi:hypothetical protein